MRKIAGFIILLGALSFQGCFATSGEIVNLRDDISQLQIRMNDMQKNQADLSAKIDNLISSLGPFSYELEMTQNRMSLLGQRLDDMEVNLSGKMNKLSEKISGSQLSSAPSPSEIYNSAYSDFSSGKYDLSIKGFESFVEKYPSSELSSGAKYYLGESYFMKKDYAAAIKTYQSLEDAHPKDKMVPAGLLRKASALELSGKKDEARKVYGSVLANFANSPEALAAKEKLDEKK